MAGSMKGSGIAYMTSSGWLGVGTSTLMRWKSRTESGLDPVMRPGPAKASVPDMPLVKSMIMEMKHGNERTCGTVGLAAQLSHCLSRRDVAMMVRETREAVKEAERSSMERITWQTPGLAWAMDETETEDAFILQVRELATNKVLLADARKTRFHGGDVAESLRKIFVRHGVPSVIKRDNGSALKSSEVESVLSENIVVALDSPPHWPKYNGNVETAQNELKKEMEEIRPEGCGTHCPVIAECAAYRLNHKPRRMLKGTCSCHALEKNEVKKNKFERRSMHYEIAALEVEIEASGSIFGKASVRRSAIVSWLLSGGHISVANGRKVSAGFLHSINSSSLV